MEADAAVTLRVRGVGPDDAKAVAALLDVLGYPCTAEEATARIAACREEPRQFLVLCECNGQPAGLAAVLWVAARPLVTVLGGEGAVADAAITYLRFSLPGLPVTFVILAGTGYLRGLQDTRTPLVVAVSTATLNLVLEVWWIFGLDYGIGASALSTVVAEVVAATVYVTMTRRATRVYGTSWRPDRQVIGGLGRAYELFGDKLPAILDELNMRLAA